MSPPEGNANRQAAAQVPDKVAKARAAIRILTGHSSFAETWGQVKKSFEDFTHEKKPDARSGWLPFSHPAGLESPLKELDAALGKGSLEESQAALAKFQKSYAAYKEVLDKSENDTSKPEDYRNGVVALNEALGQVFASAEQRVKKLKAEEEYKKLVDKFGGQKNVDGSVNAAILAKIALQESKLASETLAATVTTIESSGYENIAAEIRTKKEIYERLIKNYNEQITLLTPPNATMTDIERSELIQQNLATTVDAISKIQQAIQELGRIKEECDKKFKIVRGIILRTPEKSMSLDGIQLPYASVANAFNQPAPIFDEKGQDKTSSRKLNFEFLNPNLSSDTKTTTSPLFTYAPNFANQLGEADAEHAEAIEAILASRFFDSANELGVGLREAIFSLDEKLKKELEDINTHYKDPKDADKKAEMTAQAIANAKRESMALREAYARDVAGVPDKVMFDLMKARSQNQQMLTQSLTVGGMIKKVGPQVSAAAGKIAASTSHGAATMGISTALVAAYEIVKLIRVIAPLVDQFLAEKATLPQVQKETQEKLAALKGKLKGASGADGAFSAVIAKMKTGGETLLFKAINVVGGDTLSGTELGLDRWDGKLTALTIAHVELTQNALKILEQAATIAPKIPSMEMIKSSTELTPEEKKKAEEELAGWQGKLSEIDKKLKLAVNAGGEIAGSKTAWQKTKDEFDLMTKPDFLVALDYHLDDVGASVKSLGSKLADAVGFDVPDFNFDDPAKLQEAISQSLSESEKLFGGVKDLISGIGSKVASLGNVDLSSPEAAKATLERDKKTVEDLKATAEEAKKKAGEVKEAADKVADSLTDHSGAGATEQDMIRSAAKKLYEKMIKVQNFLGQNLYKAQKSIDDVKANAGSETLKTLNKMVLDIQVNTLFITQENVISFRNALDEILSANMFFSARAKSAGGPASRALDDAMLKGLETAFRKIELANEEASALTEQVRKLKEAAEAIPEVLELYRALLVSQKSIPTSISNFGVNLDDFKTRIKSLSTIEALELCAHEKIDFGRQNTDLDKYAAELTNHRTKWDSDAFAKKRAKITIFEPYKGELATAMTFIQIIDELNTLIAVKRKDVADRIGEIDKISKEKVKHMFTTEMPDELPKLHTDWNGLWSKIDPVVSQKLQGNSLGLGKAFDQILKSYSAFKQSSSDIRLRSAFDTDAKAVCSKMDVYLGILKDENNSKKKGVQDAAKWLEQITYKLTKLSSYVPE